jgi:hypothetical protein
MDNINMSQTIEPATQENTSSFEDFLIKWIDTDKLDSYMGIVKSNPGIISFVVSAIGLPSPPTLFTLEDVMRRKGEISRENQRQMCEFKDHLLDYVMYIFSYYGMNFTHTITTTTPPEKQSIFITYGTAPNSNNGSISEENYDKIDDSFKILALRISKIYKIITKYIIGFYDLSQHSVRKELLQPSRYFGNSRVLFPTHYRMIFILAELYENERKGPQFFENIKLLLFGKPSNSSSPGYTQEYSGGKYTKRKRIRKTITQKKRASRLSSSL